MTPTIDREEEFRKSGNALTARGILELPIPGRPFRVVSFPSHLSNPTMDGGHTSFLIVRFREQDEFKLFQLPTTLVRSLEEQGVTAYQNWKFELSEENRNLKIVPFHAG